MKSNFKYDLLIIGLGVSGIAMAREAHKNKLKYLDPKNYLDSTFHKKAIEESEKLMINTKFENLNYNSHLIIAETFVRFRFTFGFAFGFAFGFVFVIVLIPYILF